MKVNLLLLLLLCGVSVAACSMQSSTPYADVVSSDDIKVIGDSNTTITIPERYFTCEQDSDCIIVEGGSHVCTCNSAINKEFENQFHIAAQRSRDEQYASQKALPACAVCGPFDRSAAACVSNRCAYSGN